ncbi:MAG: DUF4115 domain-containing protein [Serpentinimonas sp.]|nr:DUF4115 domain-containing protein [Serpentinimonas sp.]
MNELRPEQPAADASSATGTSAAAVLTLRQARESSGMHAAALAATLKVPLRQLEALEAGRYHELPDLTFARALTRSVCRQLKVDPGPVLAQMPTAGQVRLGESDTALHTPMPQAGASVLARAVSAPVQSLSTPAALALLVLVIAVALWFLLPQQAVPDPLAASEPQPALSTPEQADILPAAPVQPAAPVAAAPARPVAAPAAAPAPAATAAPLHLRAQQNAWVQVTGASGRVLLQRHLQAGEDIVFADDLPLQLVIGRADAVQVAVHGQALDLALHSRNNVARLEVR